MLTEQQKVQLNAVVEAMENPKCNLESVISSLKPLLKPCSELLSELSQLGITIDHSSGGNQLRICYRAQCFTFYFTIDYTLPVGGEKEGA